MAKIELPKWSGRDILDESHAEELDRRAAAHEFDSKLPRHMAETEAYREYKNENHAKAAAAHLMGMKSAQGSGSMDEARKHGAMYALHLKELGEDIYGPVPAKVKHYVDSPDREKVTHFKAHKGDAFLLKDGEKERSSEPDSREPRGSTHHAEPSEGKDAQKNYQTLNPSTDTARDANRFELSKNDPYDPRFANNNPHSDGYDQAVAFRPAAIRAQWTGTCPVCKNQDHLGDCKNPFWISKTPTSGPYMGMTSEDTEKSEIDDERLHTLYKSIKLLEALRGAAVGIDLDEDVDGFGDDESEDEELIKSYSSNLRGYSTDQIDRVKRARIRSKRKDRTRRKDRSHTRKDRSNNVKSDKSRPHDRTKKAELDKAWEFNSSSKTGDYEMKHCDNCKRETIHRGGVCKACKKPLPETSPRPTTKAEGKATTAEIENDGPTIEKAQQLPLIPKERSAAPDKSLPGKTCRGCGGYGRVPDYDASRTKYTKQFKQCPDCDGSGDTKKSEAEHDRLHDLYKAIKLLEGLRQLQKGDVISRQLPKGKITGSVKLTDFGNAFLNHHGGTK